MKRLIIFLIRRRLGLRKYQSFQFANQKNKTEYYYFGDDAIWKQCGERIKDDISNLRLSGVSLNRLLDGDCEIIKF